MWRTWFWGFRSWLMTKNTLRARRSFLWTQYNYRIDTFYLILFLFNQRQTQDKRASKSQYCKIPLPKQKPRRRKEINDAKFDTGSVAALTDRRGSRHEMKCEDMARLTAPTFFLIKSEEKDKRPSGVDKWLSEVHVIPPTFYISLN